MSDLTQTSSWIRRIPRPSGPPAGRPFAWLRFLHHPLALLGLPWIDPAHWQAYLAVLIVLTLEWPFHIQLAQGIEMYVAAEWTSAAAAYILGPAVLPVFWLSAVLGFALIYILDGAGLVRASGISAETVQQLRGLPHPEGTAVDGHLRGFVNMSAQAVRALTIMCVRTTLPETSLLVHVFLTESAVATWLAVVPIPGRMAPRLRWRRLAEALGRDMLIATATLQVIMVFVLLVSYERGGTSAFIATSVCTLVLHSILKRLNDTRVESEQRRQDLLRMQGELDRRRRLAVIGSTASAVLHQIGRQHGAIGFFAHLLARDAEQADGPDWRGRVREHVSGILTSIDEANRVVDELIRFGQDRALNLYPQPVDALLEECLVGSRPRATEHRVQLVLTAAAADCVVTLDKHKIKQALGNVLDNAIDASPEGGRIEVQATAGDGVVEIAVRDYGAGIAEDLRPQLFTPFCTTKPGGIGLGLALALELIEAHGGRITWHGAAPGTVFVVTLPLAPTAETSTRGTE